MIFWIIVGLMVVSTVVCIAAIANFWDYIDAVSLFGTIVLWIAVVIMTSCIATSNLGAEGRIEKYQKRYEILTYQLVNDVYDNDNDLGKRELYEQVREWNEDLGYYKHVQKDFWIGIFYPNIYDNFEYIELP